jgi:hypothetical protein
MKKPVLRLTGSAATATTYTFRAVGDLGWAICTVNDATGELAITSDWGNWSHVWNPRHLGVPSLTHFIGDRKSYDYLANKLLGRADCWVLDADATITKWRKQLAERRLKEGRHHARVPDSLRTRDYLAPLHDHEPLTREHARDIWESLGSLYDDELHESHFIEHAYQIEGFSYWITERPWESTEHRTSNDYNILVETILPALAEVCELEAATRPQVKAA